MTFLQNDTFYFQTDSHVLTSKKTTTCINQRIHERTSFYAWLLFRLVTRHHAKHVLNYEYLTSAQITHICESVCTQENVMRLLNKVRQHFLHFCSGFVEFMK